MRIVTPRLVLRPLGREDLAPMVEMIGDYEVARWLRVVPHPYTRADGDEFLARLEESDVLAGLGIECDGAFIGVVGIMDGGLGYWLGRAYHGRGYMTEAAGALVDYHFEHGAHEGLASGYFRGNAASSGVLEKLGFVHTGEAERVVSQAQGAEVTLMKMVLDRRDWEARRGN